MVIVIAGDYIFNLGLYFCRTATYPERERTKKDGVCLCVKKIIIMC